MTTDDLAWVQSRLRNCTNARRQLRICAECLSVAEDTLLERLGYTSLDTFRAAHPQNKQPVCPPVERIYNPVPPEMMMESILYYYGGAPISTVRSMMGYTQTVTPEAIRHRVCNWKKKHPALAAGMPRKRPKPKKETKPMKMTYDEAGLPAYAYAKSPYTGAVVRIVRGERALFGILFGRGRRALSEQYGLKVWLCHDHHNEPPLGVHFDPAARRVLEQAAQFAFDELHGPGSFAEVFGEEI